MNPNLVRWLKTTGLTLVGGGIAATITQALDPSIYHFPEDLGSGKLWVHFLGGMVVAFVALLMKSPLDPSAK